MPKHDTLLHRLADWWESVRFRWWRWRNRGMEVELEVRDGVKEVHTTVHRPDWLRDGVYDYDNVEKRMAPLAEVDDDAVFCRDCFGEEAPGVEA